MPLKSKLTLWIDGHAKKVGKEWAKRHHESLSKVVTDYLLRLETNEKGGKIPVTPLVRRLSGVISKSSLTRKDHRSYLEKKYLGAA